ncbi:MAG: ribbon-helix-helix domain-containing protein [Desulfobacteraceae bacterium]|nr:ribbon-helix-helix domain-containing protein [Desulfobacteraceae bacterium]
MKVKTSITLSRDLICQIDALSGRYGNRSAFIEKAVRALIDTETRRARDLKDLKILNEQSSELNKEAEEVLTFLSR